MSQLKSRPPAPAPQPSNNGSRIRVVIVENHQLVSESLGLLLDVCDQGEPYAMLPACRQHGQPPEVDMLTFLVIADTTDGLVIEQR